MCVLLLSGRIPFETGDTIIQQGEKGSWAGMLLEGEFDAYVEARQDFAQLDWVPCFSQQRPGCSFPRIALPFHDRASARSGPCRPAISSAR